MKYTELPFPGTNNERVRAELAGAISRVQFGRGGYAQELYNCIQAAIECLLAETGAKYTELPFPGVNNERVRAELSAAVSRVRFGRGGDFENLGNCLQAALDALSQYVGPAFYYVAINFNLDGEPYYFMNYTEPFAIMGAGDTLTPTYILTKPDGSTENVPANSNYFNRFQVQSNEGRGYENENDWLTVNPTTGVITAKSNENVPLITPGKPGWISVRRELIHVFPEGQAIAYAFAYIEYQVA